MSSEQRRPLEGVRVIEAGGVGPTPFCTMLLADMGADVVRVVRPASTRPQDVAFFARGKRAVEVDLKADSGLAYLLTLADRADVLVEGFRPGVAERLGFGPETVLGRNPRLVFARCTGWGQSGPMSQRAGHDINYIALSGALGLVGPADGPPVPPLNLLGDFAGGGLTAAFGIATALVERGTSGLGQVLDVSMAEGASLLTTIFHEMIAMGGHDESRRGGNFLDGGSPCYAVYETSDGGWFAVGAVEPAFYAELVGGLGLDPTTLPNRDDSSQWPALRARFAAAFAARTRAEWTDVFAGVDACATPVLSPTEAYDHEHHRARAAFIDIDGVRQPAPAPRLSRTPAAVRAEGVAGATTPEDVLRDWPSPTSVPLG